MQISPKVLMLSVVLISSVFTAITTIHHTGELTHLYSYTIAYRMCTSTTCSHPFSNDHHNFSADFLHKTDTKVSFALNRFFFDKRNSQHER